MQPDSIWNTQDQEHRWKKKKTRDKETDFGPPWTLSLCIFSFKVYLPYGTLKGLSHITSLHVIERCPLLRTLLNEPWQMRQPPLGYIHTWQICCRNVLWLSHTSEWDLQTSMQMLQKQPHSECMKLIEAKFTLPFGGVCPYDACVHFPLIFLSKRRTLVTEMNGAHYSQWIPFVSIG